MIMLFLAAITLTTTHSPGDDGMTKEKPESFVQAVEAESAEEAEAKVRKKYERDEPYVIRVDVAVTIRETIR